MPTKYDVFAEIIEHAPCKAIDLSFTTPVYAHIRSLLHEGYIKKDGLNYTPIKNDTTLALFNIIKYCLKNGLDYNRFLSKNMPTIINELFKHAPDLRPKRLQANKENTALLKYLEENQFILLVQRRPRKGIILEHQLFQYILDMYADKLIVKTTDYTNIEKNILIIKMDPVNPFSEEVFQFLAGSAQLEGSTVTLGETRELILNDIYPDKPEKDIQMVKNLNEAIHYVLEHLEEEITVEHIKELNKLVMFGLHRNAGRYKTTHNRIQGNPAFKTAHPHQVSHLMDAYCTALQNITAKNICLERIGYVHNELQHIHPFSDGNSRTTRMILNWTLMRHKLPLLVIKMGCFDEYMRLTKLAKKRNDKRLTMLFQHVLLHEHLLN
ncbi:MAG: Fic family protein [Candidatus Woesearchaeota archaeon]